MGMWTPLMNIQMVGGKFMIIFLPEGPTNEYLGVHVSGCHSTKGGGGEPKDALKTKMPTKN
jgi:hypothetical protein